MNKVFCLFLIFFSINLHAADKIYVATVDNPLLNDPQSSFYALSPDGQNVEKLFSDASFADEIVIDATQSLMYWNNVIAEFEASSIKSANLDGSSIQTIIGQINDPVSLEIDVMRGILIWAEIDGSEITVFKLKDFVLDFLGGHSTNFGAGFAIDYLTGNIFAELFDGSALIEIDSKKDTSKETNFPVNLGAEFEIDPANRKIYWKDNSEDFDKILKANLDGTGLEEVFDGAVTNSTSIRNLILDLTNNRVLFSDDDLLYAVDLGTGEATLLSELENTISAIAVFCNDCSHLATVKSTVNKILKKAKKAAKISARLECTKASKAKLLKKINKAYQNVILASFFLSPEDMNKKINTLSKLVKKSFGPCFKSTKKAKKLFKQAKAFKNTAASQLEVIQTENLYCGGSI